MLLNKGSYGGERILSRASVELMTTDQLTDAQKAISGLTPGDFDAMGWGFGVGMVTRKTEVAWSVGAYGWDGGLGTSWRNDPNEGLVGILLTQRAWTAPKPPPVCRDFWTLTYAALED
jgi:CubicO group peptidase (beta-lactamase class C family)